MDAQPLHQDLADLARTALLKVDDSAAGDGFIGKCDAVAALLEALTAAPTSWHSHERRELLRSTQSK